MPRPRTHDPQTVLDAAESLAAASGPTAVTVRAVAAATGVSNGALYHTFGSRQEVLARTWLRAAHRFLDLQSEAVALALAATDHEARIDAVIDAAETPARLAERHPGSARLLLLVDRAELLAGDLPPALAKEITDTEKALLATLSRLARTLWGRADRRGVATVTTCLVDLPTALLLRRDRLTDPLARAQLRVAVRAVLDLGPH
ncbi:TetR family transcriptional regulator [Nocardia mangyaensis]|uniref:TetR family transcriptional regulator n=1 Tax=Nocardia mangyaensis TaxID=2213200 RepID=UPI00267467A8|nr:TetR family transcriptional regulator [Nocardia mangyaensis]MDO3646395.1 TetR family transcriptional regulator [Nocardia mangyaensis]